MLAWPDARPLGLLVVLVVAMGAGGPGVADRLRLRADLQPAGGARRAGGFVNVGGFTASFTMMFLIGLLLDAQHGATGAPLYSLGAFACAFTVQYVDRRRRRDRVLADPQTGPTQLLRDEGVDVGPLWRCLPPPRRDTQIVDGADRHAVVVYNCRNEGRDQSPAGNSRPPASVVVSCRPRRGRRPEPVRIARRRTDASS